MESLAKRIRVASQLKGSFVLRSGAVSDTYFDKYRFESDPKLLREIATAMVPLIPKATEVLAGMEMGGIPVATVLSQITGLPAAFIRKQPKTYGTCLYAEGAPLAGRRFLIVEDVVSSGGAIIDALKLLAGDGLRPCGAICVIDRETGCKEAMTSEGLEFRALLTMSQINGA